MKITISKVKRELKEKHGWDNLNENNPQKFLIDELIKDVLDVVNDELLRHKGISIRKRSA